MRGFAARTTLTDALRWVDRHAAPREAERTRLPELAGRVLTAAVVSEVDVPGFTRAMMDGFAVRGGDTSGAGPYNRVRLMIRGRAAAGEGYDGELASGEALRIMTGAPLPAGTDAVIPAEKVEVQGDAVFVLEEMPPGKHVGRPGEDVSAGQEVLAAGRRLRPQDLGVLSSIGIREAWAVRQPRVRIAVTGNELLPAGSKAHGCRVADANGPMLAALVQRDGGSVIDRGIVPDEPTAILQAMRDEADVVLVSGGSSVGEEDYAPALLALHGELAIHGIAMRPSSPAGMGRLEGRLVFLLPGNPVSCLCAYDFFAGRAIRAMGGRSKDWPYRLRRGVLSSKLVSVVGRADYARVRFDGRQVQPLAIGGASVLSSTTRADGFVVVPQDSEGYPAGEEVDVWMYDG